MVPGHFGSIFTLFLVSLVQEHSAVRQVAEVQEQLQQVPVVARHEDEWKLSVAFSGRTHHLTALSHEFKRSRREIVRAIKSTAMSWLKCQLFFLQSTRQALEHQQIDIFMDSMKWDETKQTLALPFSDLLTDQQSISGWNLMVVKRRIGWCLPGKPFVWTDIVVPPQVLIGQITADCFYDALFCTKLAKDWLEITWPLHHIVIHRIGPAVTFARGFLATSGVYVKGFGPETFNIYSSCGESSCKSHCWTTVR